MIIIIIIITIIIIFIYIKMSKTLSAKYYPENKERLLKKACEKSFLRRKTKKAAI